MRRSNRTTTFYLLKTLAIPNPLLIALSVYKGGFNTLKTKMLVLEILKETSYINCKQKLAIRLFQFQGRMYLFSFKSFHQCFIPICRVLKFS